MTPPAVGWPAQSLTITDWHPTTSANARGNWRMTHKRHHVDRDMAWASAMQAGWTFVGGKVRLTIVLVYPRKYHVDADNLVAKCKGLIDGLRKEDISTRDLRHGYFTDDDTEHLDLVVRAEVEKGVKATRITLESLDLLSGRGAG